MKDLTLKCWKQRCGTTEINESKIKKTVWKITKLLDSKANITTILSLGYNSARM
jgi:predicted nucleic-acid-binding Zn-ribbon protein